MSRTNHVANAIVSLKRLTILEEEIQRLEQNVIVLMEIYLGRNEMLPALEEYK